MPDSLAACRVICLSLSRIARDLRREEARIDNAAVRALFANAACDLDQVCGALSSGT